MKTAVKACVVACAAVGAWAGRCDAGSPGASFAGRTWHVSADAGDGGDGSSARPFRQVQQAVSAADDGDVIRIGAGLYREGESATGDGTPARVSLVRRVRLVGAGRGLTVIEGGAGLGADGLGAGAVRGLYLAAEAHGSLVERLTVRGGRTVGAAEQGGGAWCAGDASATNAFVDCTFSDCVSGGAGGALSGGLLVRALVERCTSVTPLLGAVARTQGAFNCVFVGCGRSGGDYQHNLNCPVVGTGDYGPFVNCTFTANEGYAAQKVDTASLARLVFRNCLFLGHRIVSVEPYADSAYCATTLPGQLPKGKGNFGSGDESDLSSPYQMVSPLTDWRLRAESPLVNAGSDEALALVPEAYRAADFYGRPRVQGGRVDIGAAEGGVACASGIVKFPRSLASSTNVFVNGRRIVKAGMYQGNSDRHDWIYLSAAEFPARVRLVCDPGETNALFGLATGLKDRKEVDLYRFPNPDGRSFTIALPPAGQEVEMTVHYANGVKWVDPETGVDDATDPAAGSEGRPYRTLQYAADRSAEKGVVFARPGVYAEGGALARADSDDVCTTSNRLLIAKALRVVSVAGAESTVIRGRRSETDTAHDGCGPDAMRCVQFVGNVHSCVQGFTITGGATDSDPAARFAAAGKPNPDDRNRGNFGGAGVLCGTWVGWYEYGQVLDCVISNNVAYFGAATYNGWMQRCVIVGNRTVSTACDPEITRISGVVFGSALDSCLLYGNAANAYLYGQGCRLTGCTVRETAQSPFEVSAARANCVVADSPKWDAAEANTTLSCVAWPTPHANWQKDGNSCLAEDCLTSPMRGVWRLRPGCQSLSAGSTAVAFAGRSYSYWKYYTDGIDGEPLFANGSATCVAGCHGAAYEPIDRYVDSTSGNDEADGLSRATAKRTLAATLDEALPGDTVHAAPGTYADGERVHADVFAGAVSGTKIPTRAVVPPYVTLMSDGSAADTVITGVRDTKTPTQFVGSGALLSLGPGAVRCVVLGEGSRLCGFRLVDGGTSCEGTAQNDNTIGGAVLARDSSVVEDCEIRACASYCHNAYQGTYVRCVFDNDWAYGSGGAGARLRAYNCFIDRCCDVPLSSIYALRNSTIGPNCFLWGERAWPLGTLVSFRYPETAEMANNLILASSKPKSTAYAHAVNNVVADVAQSIVFATDGSCRGNAVYPLSDLPVDEQGRPLPGNKAIDAGDNAELVEGRSSDLDLAKGARVYNGAVDAGAYEYDYRAAYGKTLDRRGRVTVTEAGPEVFVVGSELLLRDGAFACAWRCRGGKTLRYANFRVTGAGVLTVRVDGGSAHEFTAKDGDVCLPFETAETISLTFAYVRSPEDSEAEGAVFSRFESQCGSLVIIR